jgi:hypothetical protein
VVSCDEPLGRTVVLEGNLGDDGGLETGGPRDVPKSSAVSGDDGKGGSGGESRFVLWSISGRCWGSSELSSRCASSVSSSKASRPEPVLLCPLDSGRRNWESGRLAV